MLGTLTARTARKYRLSTYHGHTFVLKLTLTTRRMWRCPRNTNSMGQKLVPYYYGTCTGPSVLPMGGTASMRDYSQESWASQLAQLFRARSDMLRRD